MNKLDSSHPDSDKDKNQQTVTRIFHGLYVVQIEIRDCYILMIIGIVDSLIDGIQDNIISSTEIFYELRLGNQGRL